ncbi:MAG: hypothetical protein Kow0069_28190 [Promethearchaeota archaeon]
MKFLLELPKTFEHGTRNGLAVESKTALGRLKKMGRLACGQFLKLGTSLMTFSVGKYCREIAYWNLKRTAKFVVQTVNGMKMVLPLDDGGIGRDLYFFGAREPSSTAFVRDSGMLNPGDVVLEVGANIGYYALLESKLVGPSGLIYAVEPVRGNFRLLRKNLELNGCTNVEAYRLAMGSQRGKVKIHVSTQCNLSSIKKIPEFTYSGEEEVDVLTCDEFLEDKRTPTLVRMDVEGFELEILRGMRNTLNQVDKLFVEVHGDLLSREELGEFFQILDEHGFKVEVAFWEYPTRERNSFAEYLAVSLGWKYPTYHLKPDMKTLELLLSRRVIQPSAPQVFFTRT